MCGWVGMYQVNSLHSHVIPILNTANLLFPKSLRVPGASFDSWIRRTITPSFPSVVIWTLIQGKKLEGFGYHGKSRLATVAQRRGEHGRNQWDGKRLYTRASKVYIYPQYTYGKLLLWIPDASYIHKYKTFRSINTYCS